MLKAVWASACFGELPLSVFKNPYWRGDPLAEVLKHLILKQRGQVFPPFIARFTLLSTPELCQLALLWAVAGEKELSSVLGGAIPVDYPWLWCREDVYSAEEAEWSALLLMQSLKKKEVGEVPADLFLSALFKQSIFLETNSSAGFLPYSLFQSGELQCALTLDGNRTSLGAFLSPRAQIRAFGPQTFPLSDSRGFGIRSFSRCLNSWTSLFASPSVWFETSLSVSESKMILHLSFVGLEPDRPISFSFYVKANELEIDGDKLLPKSLRRYAGRTRPAIFAKSLKVEGDFLGKMEAIPLAGSGCFWDCEFLLSFEIYPINSKISFFISLL